MGQYFKLLRIKHYIKNILVFIPLFFSQSIGNINLLISVVWGYVAFCLTASAVYVLNDLRDVEKDRNHPTKRFRPIASGAISEFHASLAAIVCGIMAFLCSWQTGKLWAVLFLALYVSINLLYSFGLKNKPIMDVVILSAGFVIRVLYGGYLVNVPISGWLYLTVIFGALYMGLGKRRNELEKQKRTGETRTVLKYYSYKFLDKNMYVCMAMTEIFYALWAMNHANQLMLWSVPILAILLIRYSYDIEGNSDGDPVEVLVHDKALILISLLLGGFLCGILYFYH